MAGSIAALPAGEGATDAGAEAAGEGATDAAAEAELEVAGEAAADAIDAATLGAAVKGAEAAGVPLQAPTVSNAAIAKETDFGNRMREPPVEIRLRTAIAGWEWLECANASS